MAEEELAASDGQGAEGGTAVSETAGIEDGQGLCHREISGAVGGEMELQGGVGVAEDEDVGVSRYGAGDGSAEAPFDAAGMAVHPPLKVGVL